MESIHWVRHGKSSSAYVLRSSATIVIRYLNVYRKAIYMWDGVMPRVRRRMVSARSHRGHKFVDTHIRGHPTFTGPYNFSPGVSSDFDLLQVLCMLL